MSVHRNIIPNYNQQDATFLGLFISTDVLHVSGGSSAHQQEHITVHTASLIGWQYLKLYVQLCAPDDRWRNWCFRWFLRPSSGAHNYTYSFNYWLTIPEAVCTVMCSWWWVEKLMFQAVPPPNIRST